MEGRTIGQVLHSSAVTSDLAADGRVILTKLGDKPPPSRFDRFLCIAGPGLTTDEIMALTRSD